MKIYILTKDSTRCFGDGTELHFNDRFICICTDLNTAKRAIDRHMEPYTNFREKSSFNGGMVYDREVYGREYVDRYDTGDSEIFRIRVKEIDDIPEVKENSELKKKIKELELRVEYLDGYIKAKGSVPVYKEKSSEKKEEKSYVNRW